MVYIQPKLLYTAELVMSMKLIYISFSKYFQVKILHVHEYTFLSRNRNAIDQNLFTDTDKCVNFPINSKSNSRVSCNGGCSLLNGNYWCNTIGFYFKLMTRDLDSVLIMLLFHKDSLTQGLSTKPVLLQFFVHKTFICSAFCYTCNCY